MTHSSGFRIFTGFYLGVSVFLLVYVVGTNNSLLLIPAIAVLVSGFVFLALAWRRTTPK
jgi:hypothetical protein